MSAALPAPEAGGHSLADGTMVEVGALVANTLGAEGFETIAFDHARIAAPAIFSEVQTFAGADFVGTRRRRADGASVEVALQKEDAANRTHACETVGWMATAHDAGALADGAMWGAEDLSWTAVEAESRVLADARVLKARLREVGATTRQGFAPIAFDAPFAADPAVLGQVQTADGAADGAACVKTQMQGIDAARFQVALGEEAASRTPRAAQTAGWIALDRGGAAATDGFAFGAGEITASHAAARQTLAAPLAAPGVVASRTTHAGRVASAARIDALTGAGFGLRAQEGMSLDVETTDACDIVHRLAFESGAQIRDDMLL